MKRLLFAFLCISLLILPISRLEAFTIDLNSSTISFNGSWDTPSETIVDVLKNRYGTSDITLTLVNGFAGEIETWFGKSAYTLMLEEIAGYAQKTNFGWYEVGQPSVVYQLFPGSAEAGAEAMVQFASETNFGFYIDPNGKAANRMYTEHLLNTHDDYQVTVWQVNDSPYNFILGWEDLDLYGGSGGDRDYQDMIVSLEVNPVPEPATIFLFGTGLFSLVGVGRKKLKK
jgi:hypothetical protein